LDAGLTQCSASVILRLRMTEQQNSENKNPISSPPSLDVEIRTMETDIESVKASGGDLTNPQFIRLGESPMEPIKSPEEPKTNLDIPGYTGPEKAIFSPAPTVDSKDSQSPAIKIILMIIAIFIAAAAIGFLSYYLASRIF